jgi:hypothetical protein
MTKAMTAIMLREAALAVLKADGKPGQISDRTIATLRGEPGFQLPIDRCGPPQKE